MTNRDIDREVALARQGLAPSAALRDRVRSGLRSSDAVTRGASALVVAEMMRSQSPWEALRASGRVGLMAGAALLALGVTLGSWLGSPESKPPLLPRAPVAANLEGSAFEPQAGVPLALEPEARDAEPRAEEREAPPPRQPVTSRPRRLRASRTSPQEPLPTPPATPSDEVSLLQRAERAIRNHNPELALALTAELDERYPRSQLMQERHAIRLLARCDSVEPHTRSNAAQFLRTYPQSVYASRIRQLCLSDAASDEPVSTKSEEP